MPRYQIVTLSTGQKQLCLMAGLAQGKAHLMKQGYTPCQNPRILRMGNHYATYNEIHKHWSMT